MILAILANPNPALRKKAKPVRTITLEIRKLVVDLTETMYSTEHGVGLAATQVGQLCRVAVIDTSKKRDQLLVLVNPKITEKSREKAKGTEGCLSVPGFEGDVERCVTIKVKTLNRPEFEATGFLARAIQHEVDHLDGILYIDRLYGNTGLRRLESKKTPLE